MIIIIIIRIDPYRPLSTPIGPHRSVSIRIDPYRAVSILIDPYPSACVQKGRNEPGRPKSHKRPQTPPSIFYFLIPSPPFPTLPTGPSRYGLKDTIISRTPSFQGRHHFKAPGARGMAPGASDEPTMTANYDRPGGAKRRRRRSQPRRRVTSQ